MKVEWHLGRFQAGDILFETCKPSDSSTFLTANARPHTYEKGFQTSKLNQVQKMINIPS